MTESNGKPLFVDVNALAIHTWMTRPGSSIQRDLIEQLLWRFANEPLQMRTLAAVAGRPLDQMARALFDLNRGRQLLIRPATHQPDSWEQSSLSGHLASLKTTPEGSVVLADSQGFCVAHEGCASNSEAQRLAARACTPAAVAFSVQLWLRTGAYIVASTSPLNTAATGWVSLAKALTNPFQSRTNPSSSTATIVNHEGT